MVVAAAAVGGGTWFRDQESLKAGQEALSQGEGQLESAPAQSHELFKKALVSLAGVSAWTPLNKEAAALEKKALVGLWRTELKIRTQPDAILAALRRLAALDVDAAELDKSRTQADQQLTRETLLRLERDSAPGTLDEFWNKLFSEPAPELAKLELGELINAGKKRAEIRRSIEAVKESMLKALDPATGSVDRKLWKTLGAELKSGCGLAEAQPIYVDFEARFKELQETLAELIAVHAVWSELAQLEDKLNQSFELLVSDPLFIGNLLESEGAEVPTPKLASPPKIERSGVMNLIEAYNRVSKRYLGRVSELNKFGKRLFRMSLIEASSDRLLFMDRVEVTRAKFADFIHKQRGYTEGRKYWSKDGWQGKENVRGGPLSHPFGWKDDEGAGDVAVSGLSIAEAEAYAQAQGKRLPYKSEWLIAYGNRSYPWGEDWREGAAVFGTDTIKGPEPVGIRKDGSNGKAEIQDLLGNVGEYVMELNDGKVEFWIAGSSYEEPLNGSVIEGLKDAGTRETLLFGLTGNLCEQRKSAGVRLVAELRRDSSNGSWQIVEYAPR